MKAFERQGLSIGLRWINSMLFSRIITAKLADHRHHHTTTRGTLWLLVVNDILVGVLKWWLMRTKKKR